MNKAKATQYRKGMYTALIICIIFSIYLVGFAAAGACPDDNNIQSTNLPCEMLTPPQMNCTGNATILNLANSTQTQNVSMTLKYASSGVYNFTFNFTDLGFYYVQLCDNSTAVLRVYDKDIIETAAPVNLVSTSSIISPEINLSSYSLRQQFGIVGGGVWNFLLQILVKWWWLLLVIFVFLIIILGARRKKHETP